MKQSEIWNFNLPELSDPIDVREITRNFELIDLGLEAAMCRKTRKTNTLSEQAYPPAIRIKNYNDFDIEVVDRAMLGTKIEIKAGEIKTINIRQIRPANFFVEGLHEAQFEWYIPTEKAIEEGGGGSGGTSDYNDLQNQPKINNVTLAGNKSFQDLGLLNSDGVIKSDFLPPFVDNMDSYPSKANFPAEGVEDRLYLAKDTNLAYVWTGVGEDKYACVGTSLALGETSSTAYRGDRGKTAWEHSQSTHARTDATKTEASQTNGNIKINGTETPVYQHPGTGTNPHGTTAADLGLDKALKYSSQSLSETDKAQARQNIGAGTSSFNGQYSSLTGIPQSFTPAPHTHPSTQVTGLGAAAAKGVDTTMPASATDNNVPTTQLMQSQLDKKVNKTEVSSSNETTSTIAITDNSQMAMVASIKGKTVKLNLFDMDEFIKVDPTNITKVNDKSFQIKGSWYKDLDITLKASTKYTLSIKVVSSNVQSAVIIVDSSGTPIMSESLKVTGSVTVTTTSGTSYKIRIYSGNATSGTSVYSDVQLEEGTVAHSYAPFGLVSAPVESVVSTTTGSAVIYDRVLYNASNGAPLPTSNRTSTNIVRASKGFAVKFNATSKSSKAIKIYVREMDENKARIIDTDWLSPSGTYTIVSANAKYVCLVAKYNDGTSTGGDMIIGDISITWNLIETTVLVPQSIRNLPDYGVENNIVDFENGTYTHNNTISNGAVTAYTGTDKVIPISDYLRPLPVENGGTLTLVNEHNLDVNSTIKYKKEV